MMDLKTAATIVRKKTEGNGGGKAPRNRTPDGSQLETKSNKKPSGGLFGTAGFERRFRSFVAMSSNL
jgi:hypothetical protein